jgi:hypothetical protein
MDGCRLRRDATRSLARRSRVQQPAKTGERDDRGLDAAEGAQRKKPKSKRIGFVQWSPKRSITYYSSAACTTQFE